MRYQLLTLALVLMIIAPVLAINNSHKRCDKLALGELTKKRNILCKGKKKRSKECLEVEKDIVDYLTAFHSHNDAFCVRLQSKHRLKLIPAYYQNPDRVI